MGNHYEQIPDGQYRITKSKDGENEFHFNNKYTAFVRLKKLPASNDKSVYEIEDIVESVDFWKHESFMNHNVPLVVKPGKNDDPRRLKASRNDELTWSATVWGYFPFDVTINYKPYLKKDP